jgi:response regulator NasT
MEFMIIQRTLQTTSFTSPRHMNSVLNADLRHHKPGHAGIETYSVVVADDDRTMAELLATNLRRLGHRVAGIAWNGKEAVDLVLKTRPDVVVMDIHMPVLDGIEAARQILAEQLVPIVMSTGMSDAMTVHRAIDLNLISYLVKPFSPAQLKVAVQLAVAQCRSIASQDAISTAA